MRIIHFFWRFLPVSHFESDIVANITTSFSIPLLWIWSNVNIYLVWAKMLKIVNKKGRQLAVLYLTSWGISPLDSAYPKTPSSKQKRSLYIYLFWSYEQRCWKCQTKWPPVSYFVSDIIENITNRSGIPQNTFFETKMKSLLSGTRVFLNMVICIQCWAWVI